jgi:hypothetical protein
MDKGRLLNAIGKAGIRITAGKIRKRDLRLLEYSLCLAKMSSGRLGRKIGSVFENYYFMDNGRKTYLKKIFLDAYRYGYRIVDGDTFTNSTWATWSELDDRFHDHPDVDSGNIEFLERLAAGDEGAMNQIFRRNVAVKGYEDHFVFVIYRDHFIDGSDDMASKIGKIPEGLDPDKVLILSQNGYADGVQDRVRELATEAVQADAEEMLEEIRGVAPAGQKEAET